MSIPMPPDGALNLELNVEKTDSSLTFELDLYAGFAVEPFDFCDIEIRSSMSL